MQIVNVISGEYIDLPYIILGFLKARAYTWDYHKVNTVVLNLALPKLMSENNRWEA